VEHGVKVRMTGHMRVRLALFYLALGALAGGVLFGALLLWRLFIRLVSA
jgi:hypothetical protein